jgi:hypothetical protein
MALSLLDNGEGGLSARNKINAAISAVNALPPSNLTAIVDPTAANDNSQGYVAGSRWLNVVTGIAFVCRDATNGAAKWVRMDNADFFGYVSGRFYQGINVKPVAGSALPANSLRGFLVPIKEALGVPELACRITTAQASQNVQFGIYACDPATKYPTGTPLATTADITTASTGVITAALSSTVSLVPGLFFFAALGSSSSAVFQVYDANTLMASILGGTAAEVASNAATSISYLAYTATYPTWPDLTAVAPVKGNSTAYCGILFKAG